MSIISSAQRTVSSPSGSKSKVVRFQFAYNLKSLLLDFVTEKDRKLYEDLVTYIRDVGQEIRDDELVQLLKEARGCVSILDGNLRLFVQVVLILKWTHRSEEVVSEYQGFLLDLCTAHNYYTKLVIDHLVTSFKSVGETIEWDDCKPNETEEKHMHHIHQVLKSILSVIPMSQEIVMASIIKNYPYFKRHPHEHETYIYNLSQVTNYAPSLRCEILTLITDKLIGIDSHISRSELELNMKSDKDEKMDVEEEIFEMDPGDKADPLAHTLDLSMTIMLRFIHSQCHDSLGNFIWDKAKLVYTDLVKIFETVILPTHAVHHIQFIIFYFLSFKITLTLSFVKMSWRKVTNPNIAPIIRQSAVFYIASLLARANYITINVVQDTLTELTSWVHGYIDCQDSAGVTQDSRIHGVFYASCQALFYIIAFRYRELVNTNKGLVFLQGLNLGKIVTCRLNPLRSCQPAVVSNFAAVARAYQLAYCYTVMERNSRTSLPQVYRDITGAITSVTQMHIDSFFPFDPYLLPQSHCYIEGIYREYSDSVGDVETLEHKPLTRDEDVDDFLESPLIHEPVLSTFSYGASPGFLQA